MSTIDDRNHVVPNISTRLINHGVSNVPTRPGTRSKAKNIQQRFMLHLQNWIGSVQPSFLELEVDTISTNIHSSSTKWIGSVQPSFLELEADTIDEGQLNIGTVKVGNL